MENQLTVNLTQEDYEMLMHIYKKRLNLFIKTFTFLFALGFFVVFKVGKGYSEMSYISTIMMNTSLVVGFITINAIIVYRKRLIKVKRDAMNGVKEIVSYIVTQKQYFEHTGQFFIGLNHPDYLFHEIDYVSWEKINIGDTYLLYRAPLSKYVFNPQGKFSII